jgi:hypothetical protein
MTTIHAGIEQSNGRSVCCELAETRSYAVGQSVLFGGTKRREEIGGNLGFAYLGYDTEDNDASGQLLSCSSDKDYRPIDKS